jgi:hypothetical protein
MVFSYSHARNLKWGLDSDAGTGFPCRKAILRGQFDVFACGTYAGVAIVPSLPGSGLPCSRCIPLKMWKTQLASKPIDARRGENSLRRLISVEGYDRSNNWTNPKASSARFLFLNSTAPPPQTLKRQPGKSTVDRSGKQVKPGGSGEGHRGRCERGSRTRAQ